MANRLFTLAAIVAVPALVMAVAWENVWLTIAILLCASAVVAIPIIAHRCTDNGLWQKSDTNRRREHRAIIGVLLVFGIAILLAALGRNGIHELSLGLLCIATLLLVAGVVLQPAKKSKS
ncbi:MAG TPA: hypothetical protein VNA68_02860 [Candidatus Dormibacteraeota bacterium]|nr:hypothetical protein [Candidatus Dormibacteraeota bacterium]